MSLTPESAAQAAARAQRELDPNDLTQGSIGRHLLRLALPGALTNLLSFSTMLVDTIWLGRVSPAAIAAVATFNYIWFLSSLLNQMVGNGSVALISRSYGAKQIEDCKKIFGQTFSFKFLVACLVSVIGLLVLPWAISAFGAPADVAAMALTYGRIMFCATPLLFCTFTLKTGFRAVGDMRTLLKISAITALINFLVDPILIFERVYLGPWPRLGLNEPLFSFPGFGLGIAGAAWGTVIAFGFVFLQAMFIFTSGRTFLKMPLRYFFSLSLDTSWRILRIGVPPAIGDSLQNIANIFVGAAINTYGTSVFAAQGVNQILMRLVRMTVFGFNMAGITLVGQNLGAKNPERAERAANYALLAISALMLGIAGVVYFMAPGIARLFIPNADADSLAAMEWTVRIMRINCFVFLPFGLARVARAAFEGSGYTKPPMYTVALTTWGVQLPLTLLGVYGLKVADPYFIWWIEAGTYSLAATILFVVMRRGNWKKVKV